MKEATMTVEFTILVPDDTKIEDLTIELRDPVLCTPTHMNIGKVTGYTTINVEKGELTDDEDEDHSELVEENDDPLLDPDLDFSEERIS